MKKTVFGTTSKGISVHKYDIANSKGMKVVLTDFGAAIVDLMVPDRNGSLRDVSLGYDDVASYERETTYFGAIVGPYANRVADAKCEIDGIIYTLDANNNENNLHSGYNSKCQVTYEVNEDNQLVISYHAVSDKKTTFNMTNHTYFNLNGEASGNVLGHELMIHASGYTPVKSAKAIPTGEIAPVEGNPFDFRTPKKIGKEIDADFEQLIFGQGYDHNFALDKSYDGVEKIAEAYAPESGIVMEVYTDAIGVQLYTGNFMEGQKGKNGISYVKHGGFCLETQYFPNSINEPNFIRPVVDANEVYETVTIYGFGVRE